MPFCILNFPLGKTFVPQLPLYPSNALCWTAIGLPLPDCVLEIFYGTRNVALDTFHARTAAVRIEISLNLDHFVISFLRFAILPNF